VGLIAAVLTVITLLLLTGLFEQLPEAMLAAVVIAPVMVLVDYHSLVALYHVYSRDLGRRYGVAARPDFLAAMAALAGGLFFANVDLTRAFVRPPPSPASTPSSSTRR
jgi:MFS superfamily sulfate permease-like transporter